MTTAELDEVAERTIRAAGARPAFKGYHGFPAAICTSVNDEVIHGIPSGRRVLNEGDVISIDVGAQLQGYFGDSAVTLPVGQISEAAATLLRVTEESLYKAIEVVKPGGRVSDIGHAVQAHVEQARRVALHLRQAEGARAALPQVAASACTRETRLALYRSWLRWPVRRVGYQTYQVPEFAEGMSAEEFRAVRDAVAEAGARERKKGCAAMMAFIFALGAVGAGMVVVLFTVRG